MTLLLASVSGPPAIAAKMRAPASPLSPTENKLVQTVDRQLPRSLELLERAVNLNSGTSNLDGVREVGQLFAAELDVLGFQTRWVDGAGFGRAGHLIAERGSAQSSLPKVVLVGHLDTVFERDSPFQRLH